MNDLTDSLLPEQAPRTFPVRFVLFAAVSATAIYFSTQGDYATASAIALLAVALRSGYRAGAAPFLGLLAGGALAMVAAVPLAKAVEPNLASLSGTQGLTNRLLSIAVAGASLVGLVTLAAWFGGRKLIRSRPRLQACNRWLGMACGGIQGCLLVLILAGGTLVVEPLARDELLIRQAGDRSLARRVSEQVVMAAEMTRAGKLGPLVAAGNPFEHVKSLKSLQHGVEVLRSPATLQTVVEHPAIESVYQRPELQETLAELRADPELRDVFSSQQPITRETLASLMENPAVLRLLENGDFVRSLSQALGEVDPQALLRATASR